jgi:endonuclease/exonuclease/phosphatase family metal-dependent hydrolase
VERAADIIQSLDVDLVAVQEIADEDSWNELVKRLPNHDGLLSAHTYFDGNYQKVGFLYRCGVLALGANQLRFTADSQTFPRPPLFAEFTYDDGTSSFDFTAVALHLKASEEANSSARRKDAIIALEDLVRTKVDQAVANNDAGGQNFILMGDFNQTFDETDGSNWDPFANDVSRYTVVTEALTGGNVGSYISGGNNVIDHIVVTASMRDRIGQGRAIIARPDQPISDYRADVSDHRPVFFSFRALGAP